MTRTKEKDRGVLYFELWSKVQICHAPSCLIFEKKGCGVPTLNRIILFANWSLSVVCIYILKIFRIRQQSSVLYLNFCGSSKSFMCLCVCSYDHYPNTYHSRHRFVGIELCIARKYRMMVWVIQLWLMRKYYCIKLPRFRSYLVIHYCTQSVWAIYMDLNVAYLVILLVTSLQKALYWCLTYYVCVPPTTKPHTQARDTRHHIPYCFFLVIILWYKTIIFTDPYCVISWRSYRIKKTFL